MLVEKQHGKLRHFQIHCSEEDMMSKGEQMGSVVCDV